MPEIALLCGLPGSGKSTWAAARASTVALRVSAGIPTDSAEAAASPALTYRATSAGAVVFNPDRWMIRLFGHHMPREVFDARLAECMALIYEQAVEFTKRGHDVVIDAGFWKRSHRAAARTALHESGATLRLYWFDVPQEDLRRRLARRNADLPADTFEITDAMLDQFSAWFERPDAGEGIEIVLVSGNEIPS